VSEFRTIKAAEVKIDSLRYENETLRRALDAARSDVLKVTAEKAEKIERLAQIDAEALALSDCYRVLDGMLFPSYGYAFTEPKKSEPDERVVRILTALAHRYGVTR
jgi:hypothetical protein